LRDIERPYQLWVQINNGAFHFFVAKLSQYFQSPVPANQVTCALIPNEPISQSEWIDGLLVQGQLAI
jgi:hypothetical protein